MLHPELSMRVAHERYKDSCRNAERHRLDAFARRSVVVLTLPRRAARPLGRALLWLGGGLLRYGLADASALARTYGTSTRSVELN